MNLSICSANIFTGDPDAPWAEAVAVENGKISAIGSNEKIKALGIGPVIDLPGRLVTPGLVDAHTHFTRMGLSLQWIDLKDQPSLEACLEKIHRAAQEVPKGKWLIGFGWNHNQWKDKREPLAKDLEKVAPHHPAMMMRVCSHCIWVNSLAMEKAGITAETPDPSGGSIDKDPATGQPNGLIREARYLIQDHIPAPTISELKEAVRAAQKEAVKRGITGVHTMETLEEWEAVRALDESGELKVRIYHLFPAEDLDNAAKRGIVPKTGGDRLWYGHAKLFADGSLGAQTALMHEPYEGFNHCGIPFLEQKELTGLVKKAYGLGFDVAIHAIGDKAVSNALEAIESARATNKAPHRDRIEHIQLHRPEDREVFKRLGVFASVQPRFLPTDWQVAEKLWGKKRCRNAYAWKSILEDGIPVAFGSDTPIEPIDPLKGIHAAVTRTTPEGEPESGWFPDQKLSLAQAIIGFTSQAWEISGKKDRCGTLTPGKWADLTIFSEDLFQTPKDRMLEVPVEMTIINGEIVYQK